MRPSGIRIPDREPPIAVGGVFAKVGGVFRSLVWLWLALTLIHPAARADAIALVGIGDTWRFLAADESVPASWREVDLDDQSWRFGGSGFGRSTHGENTFLDGLLRGSGAICFRKAFEVPDVEAIHNLTLRCDWQGGFVAYLNGVEIARRNLPGVPGTPVPFDTPASVRYAGAAEEIPVPTPRLWLRPGRNVLAIQAQPYQVGFLDIVLTPELLANFNRGPYLQSVLEDRATVIWRTPTPVAGQVEFGIGDSLGETVSAPVSGTQQLTLTRLKPGTRYSYRVRSGTTPGDPVSPVASFRTLPETGGLKFLMFGDSGAGSWAQFKVARQLALTPADLIVHLGDVVYPRFSEGLTDTRCLSVYRELLRTTPFYFTWGNHDLYGGTGAFLSAFRQPTNSVSAADHRAEGTLPESFYSFDAGDAHFAVLYWPYASQYYMREGCPQLRWLEADLAATRKPWKILTIHHPVNTSGVHRFDDYNHNQIPDRLEVSDRLMPLAARYGVQLIVSGHDHNFERFHPVKGTHTLVSGGGGISLYPMIEQDANSAVFEKRWHFTAVELRGDTLRVTPVDADGRVFDALEWRHTSPDSDDPDGDGLGTTAEIGLGTRPDDPDTDGDGLSDGWEFLRNSDPRVRDTQPPEIRLAPFLAEPIPRPLAEISAFPSTVGGVQLRWLMAVGYRPVIESADRTDADWKPLEWPPGEPEPWKRRQFVEVPSSQAQRFFRIRLVLD